MISTDLAISRVLNVYHTKTSRWSMPNPVHRAQSGLVYFEKGSITYQFDHGIQTAVPGDILVFPQGLHYCGIKNTAENEFYVIDFLTTPEDALCNLKLPPIVSIGGRVSRLFAQTLADWQSGSLQSLLLCRASLYNILGELVAFQSQGSRSSILLENLLAHIHEHYTEQNFNVQQLSNAFHLSSSQIRRLFRQTLSVSPGQYILSLRVELAKNLLKHERMPVKEVAARCGFASEFYFSRLFKEKNGIPPSAF